MKIDVEEQVQAIIADYGPSAPRAAADRLRELWLQFEPKSVAGIKAELREDQETVGIPVQVLRDIGKEIGKVARKRVEDFVPLAKILWKDYGREGRVVAVYPLGKMELQAPDTILPLLMRLCRTCVTWEDADQLSMRALEPIVRRKPETWLPAMEIWLSDENKWVQRAGVTAVGRLPMKHPAYTARCLEMAATLLTAEDTDIKKATSFAIRLAARGEVAPVREFLAHHAPPEDPAATWVLCDAVRKMTKAFLPEMVSLLPRYEQWAADETLSARDRRSVESAIRTLRKAQG